MSTTVMDNTICPHCSQKFSNGSNKNRHIKLVHKVENKSKSLILCPLCADDGNREGMATNTVLIRHLRDRHNVLVEEEKLTFPNYEDFKKWKKLEYRNVDYVTARTWKDEYKKGILYHCNRSNFQGFKSGRTKNLQRNGGSIKMNGMCPSRITADFYVDGQVKVHFIKTHVGHEREVRTRRLTPEEQNVIVEKLKAGVPQSRIIEDARKIQNGKLERANLLQMEDLRYLKKKYNINKSRDPNDAAATFKKVQELNSNNRNYAFIYKEIGAEMENEESEYICIEEVSEEKLKLKEAKNEIVNKKYQDLNDKENIDDYETIREIEYQDFLTRLENFKALDKVAFYKVFDKIIAFCDHLLPASNTSTKRKLEKQNDYQQTQKKQRKQ